MMLVLGCHRETARWLGDIRSLVRRRVKACTDKSSISVKSHRSTDKHGETAALLRPQPGCALGTFPTSFRNTQNKSNYSWSQNIESAKPLLMLFHLWANSSNLSCFLAIYKFIISWCDLLDSWGSNLLSLWPSGHGLSNMLNFTSMHYSSAKLDLPEHTMSITINSFHWMEIAHKTWLV